MRWLGYDLGVATQSDKASASLPQSLLGALLR